MVKLNDIIISDDGDIFLTVRPGGISILVEPLAAIFRIQNHLFGVVPFYTMTLRMGDALFDQAGGLLINGCGFSDRLNRQSILK